VYSCQQEVGTGSMAIWPAALTTATGPTDRGLVPKTAPVVAGLPMNTPQVPTYKPGVGQKGEGAAGERCESGSE
jgi:hypothetical protein